MSCGTLTGQLFAFERPLHTRCRRKKPAIRTLWFLEIR